MTVKEQTFGEYFQSAKDAGENPIARPAAVYAEGEPVLTGATVPIMATATAAARAQMAVGTVDVNVEVEVTTNHSEGSWPNKVEEPGKKTYTYWYTSVELQTTVPDGVKVGGQFQMMVHEATPGKASFEPEPVTYLNADPIVCVLTKYVVHQAAAPLFHCRGGGSGVVNWPVLPFVLSGLPSATGGNIVIFIVLLMLITMPFALVIVKGRACKGCFTPWESEFADRT